MILKNREMFFGMIFIIFVSSLLGGILFVKNLHLLNELERAKLQEKTFTESIRCEIEKILTREISTNEETKIRTRLESRFLVGFFHPSNKMTKIYFQVSSVPIESFSSLINQSYECFVDPTNVESFPIEARGDVKFARHQLVWRSFVPGIVALPGLVLFFFFSIKSIVDKFREIRSNRTRLIFPLRTDSTDR